MKRPPPTRLALLGFVASLAAANLGGQWSLMLTPDFGGNNDTLGCSFDQTGEHLTINCGGGPNIMGDVRGRSVSFRVPTGRSGELTATFVGTLSQDDMTISGTWQLEAQGGKREGKFSATRVQAK